MKLYYSSNIPAEVSKAPIEFKWLSARDHIGPVETMTPLMLEFCNTTTCAQVTLCAGMFCWGFMRLSAFSSLDHFHELFEAAFAFQYDWRYCDRDQGPIEEVPDQPPADSALLQLTYFMRAAIGERIWSSYYQPVTSTFHSAHIVHHILPASIKKEFVTWRKTVVERIKTHYSKPVEAFKKKKEFANLDEYELFLSRHRGLALPPQILDLNFPYNHEDRENLVREFLQSLDPNKNRYLRNAEVMKSMGYAGTPYIF